MNEQIVIDFGPSGSACCLYSELVDLHALGRLQVRRATRIEFDGNTQRWQVLPATGAGMALFSSPSRRACLAWEQANLAP